MGDQASQLTESGLEREHTRVLTRIELIQVLQSRVPLNVYGIPEGVYRPDLLPTSFNVDARTGGDHEVLADMSHDTDNPDERTRSLPTIVDDEPAPVDVIRVGDEEQDLSATDELQSETGEGATAPHGSHPRVLELAGIIDARQSILDRLPDDQPLVEAKAELGGTDADVISVFAGSFASRDKSLTDATDEPNVRRTDVSETDEPPVDLPEDGEVMRVSAPNGAPEAVDPSLADDQRLLRVGVDLMQFRHAFVPIIFAEGFPAFPDGRPIWLRADYESEDVHRLFEQYLLMGQAGVRQLFLLQDLGPYTLSELQAFFILYAWEPRLRAYDIFRVAEFRKIQANRSIEIEDDHFLKAQRLFDKAMMYMETEDFIGQLTPKTAIDLMKTVVQISRMSVGLPPNAARGEKGSGGSEHTEIQAIMRTFSQSVHDIGGNGSGNSAQPGASTHIMGVGDDGKPLHGDILSDPEATHLAQELIIRLSSAKKSGV
jgi:hypothetical protein